LTLSLEMIKSSNIIVLIGIVAVLSGCSLFKKEVPVAEQPGNTMPLYSTPVADATKTAVNAIAGKWFVRTVGTMTLSGIEDEDWPYLDFVPSEGRFYGSDGCNVLNGEYKISENQILLLSNVASTMRLCESDSLSFPMQSALNSVGSFTVSKNQVGSTLLTLISRNDKVVMTLSKSDIDFLNGAWQVVQINGKSIDVAEARLIFDVIDGRISGNAGCNALKGELSRNPKVENSLQISNIITTLRSCPNLATESALLIALEEVVAANIDGKEHVKLVDASGNTTVRLKRLSRSDF